MRCKDMLMDMEKITKLQQWLYMSEENKIQVENAMGAKLELSMDEEGQVLCRSVDCPGSRAGSYDSMLSVPIWLGIIEQLENQPAIEFPGKFDNRWSEISFMGGMVMALSMPNGKLRRENIA